MRVTSTYAVSPTWVHPRGARDARTRPPCCARAIRQKASPSRAFSRGTAAAPASDRLYGATGSSGGSSSSSSSSSNSRGNSKQASRQAGRLAGRQARGQRRVGIPSSSNLRGGGRSWREQAIHLIADTRARPTGQLVAVLHQASPSRHTLLLGLRAPRRQRQRQHGRAGGRRQRRQWRQQRSARRHHAAGRPAAGAAALDERPQHRGLGRRQRAVCGRLARRPSPRRPGRSVHADGSVGVCDGAAAGAAAARTHQRPHHGTVGTMRFLGLGQQGWEDLHRLSIRRESEQAGGEACEV
eukprot:363223-Chlamydomonas_euryale.AAC.6